MSKNKVIPPIVGRLDVSLDPDDSNTTRLLYRTRFWNTQMFTFDNGAFEKECVKVYWVHVYITKTNLLWPALKFRIQSGTDAYLID